MKLYCFVVVQKPMNLYHSNEMKWSWNYSSESHFDENGLRFFVYLIGFFCFECVPKHDLILEDVFIRRRRFIPAGLNAEVSPSGKMKKPFRWSIIAFQWFDSYREVHKRAAATALQLHYMAVCVTPLKWERNQDGALHASTPAWFSARWMLFLIKSKPV